MKTTRYRWVVVVIFFLFMLLHQSDKLLIGPLTLDIIEEFNITNTQMGAVFTGALILGAFAYPIWGYLYDRFSRSKLLALASLLWGTTTWFSAIAPTYGLFVASRASTGIDDSSYPGLYSLIADYFGPKVRGKIYGLLQVSQPLGYLVGMLLALILGGAIGWRSVFIITGTLGVVLSFAIFFGVKDAPRGRGEPELEHLEEIGVYKFDWNIAKRLFKKPTLLLIFAQGFFGVFPWNVITYWFFAYLESERGYESDTVLFTMVPAVLILAAGYPIGGALGDMLFKRTPRGRMIVSAIGVILGAILMYFTISLPFDQPGLFTIMISATALFIPFAAPNVLSTIYDISLPEVRSTVQAVESFIESAGAALAPLIAGIIADQSSLGNAILVICVSTWILCFIFLIGAAYFVPKDIAILRQQLRQRAEEEQRIQRAGKPAGEPA
jgi:MFS family permease